MKYDPESFCCVTPTHAYNSITVRIPKDKMLQIPQILRH